MSQKTQSKREATESERAARRTRNDLLAKTGQLYEELERAAEEVIEEYKAENRALTRVRKAKGKYGPIPWPEKKETSPGRHSIYWKVMRPTNAKGKFRFSSKQIKREDGPEPYPVKVLRKVTDELNEGLVLDTERRLRAIERLMKAARQSQEVIRGAIKESDRG